jgi:hypothetical protein
MPETRHCAISCGTYSTDGKKCGVKAGFVSGAIKSFYPKSSTSTPSTHAHTLPHRRITQDEFKQIAGEVMQHVFTIHNEFGRFFDEQIYFSAAKIGCCFRFL